MHRHLREAVFMILLAIPTLAYAQTISWQCAKRRRATGRLSHRSPDRRQNKGYTAGFTKFWPTIGTVLAMIISLWLLGIAMKTLPVGTAYGIWVGVGAVGTVILGILLLKEPASIPRLVSVALIVAGIVGLKLST